MNNHATGSFEITMNRQPPYDTAEGITLGRSSFVKTFQGDLQGTSAGEMTSALTSVKGSAGYVAIERVTGTLQEQSGSFVLQHNGTMNRGQAELVVSVVPDSGTGDFKNIVGRMKIDIVEGKHFYTFDYNL